MTNRLACVLLALCAAAAGCGNNRYFSDDEGGARPSTSSLSAHPDELSLPYARETKVKITIRGGGHTDLSWRVVSANPAVFTVDRVVQEDSHIVAECTATGTGDTQLRLVDPSGEEERSAPISVRVPDRTRVFSHALLRVLGRDEATATGAEVAEARVLSGGKGVFAVAYFLGAQRVYGRGILGVQQPPEIKIENAITRGVVINDWFFISPTVAGTYDMKPSVDRGMRVLGSVAVVAVPPAEVRSARLVEEAVHEEDGWKDNQEVWLLLRAADAAGRDVHGVYANWTLGGAAQIGKDGNPMIQSGDLYRFRYLHGATPREVVATTSVPGINLSARTMVRASTGYVADTTYLGCSAAPSRSGGASTGLALLASLGLLVTAVSRRRRSARLA